MSIRQSMKYTFGTPGAIGNLLKGGLFSLLSFTVFFAFVNTAYLVRVLCASVEGRMSQHPKWGSLGDLFNEGVLPTLVALVYFSPVLVVIVAEQAILMTAGPSTALFFTMTGIKIILATIVTMLLPLAFIHFSIKKEFRAAFDFATLVDFIKKNTSQYVSAWIASFIFYIVAAIVGLFLLGIGVFFTTFMASVISMSLFGGAYRTCEPFGDDVDGKQRAAMVVPPPLKK